MNSEEVLQNLQIMDLAKQWPQFQSLHDMAKAELEAAAEKAAVELKQWAETKAKKAADDEARRVAAVKRQEAAATADRPRAIPSQPPQHELDLRNRVGVGDVGVE